jgi:ATP-dependent Clp protease ATP-binding subunit ClpB
VMTSNLGSQMIQQVAQEGGSEEQIREAVEEALHSRFLPEFLNRIDEVLIFHPLTREQLRRIVHLQIERLQRQLAQRGIQLEVTPAAIDAIAREGYDPAFGARPLKRVIQQQIQNPLAIEVLKHEVGEGSRVRVDHLDGEFSFEPIREGQPA